MVVGSPSVEEAAPARVEEAAPVRVEEEGQVQVGVGLGSRVGH